MSLENSDLILYTEDGICKFFGFQVTDEKHKTKWHYEQPRALQIGFLAIKK